MFSQQFYFLIIENIRNMLKIIFNICGHVLTIIIVNIQNMLKIIFNTCGHILTIKFTNGIFTNRIKFIKLFEYSETQSW